MSLGGIRDEAEIRGHRRTYIGALPGRLVRALRDAGTMNPVILLDEVDKVGADWRGDPSAALLEVLDPAQNHSFRDHYLDVELDLSEVVFIATANVVETIPGPLLDRMEVIRFDGYTVDEKIAIARGYLWPRQRERNGLREDEVSIARRRARDDRLGVHPRGRRPAARARARQAAAQDGDADRLRQASRPRSRSRSTRCATRSAGRSSSARPRSAPPSPASRPASPSRGTGGDVLFVEATALRRATRARPHRPARRRDEGVGADRALLASAHGRASSGSTSDAFDGQTFHVHVPAGAIPKDGPSAGITMATALASLLTGRPVKHTVGMTGEVTLQGRVLPIGGLKQKVLAAHAAGLTDVILPERNRADLDDVPEHVRDEMTFHPVMSLDEVLELALEPGGARCMRCRSCKPVPEEVRRAADLLERRWTSRSSARRTRAPSASTSSSRRSARSRRGRSRSGSSSSRRRACSSGAWSTRDRRASSTG